MIQVHRLEGFYWVARSGGYAKAARAFPYPITQPAVHQQVKKLEAELGLELFERVGKETMQLTAAGQRLYDFIAPFFEGLPGVVRSMLGGDYAGVLKIHSAPMFLRRLLPAWLERLREHRVGIQVELHEMSPPDLDLLRQGEADLVVDHLPEVPEDVAVMQVGLLRGFLVLPAGHPRAGGAATLAGLEDETFIAYSKGLLPHDLQMKAFARAGIAPTQTITADTAETILGFVAEGLGFSLIPWLDEQGPVVEGVAALRFEEEVGFPVYAAWRKDTPENPLLDALLETAPG